MRIAGFCLIALCNFANADDQPNARATELPYDQIKPFPPTEPTCDIDEIALRFQPQLHVSSGCHPYPAVDEYGFISHGLGISHVFTDCLGSPEGSQVYGRGLKFKGHIAVLFAWYFPRDYMVSPFWFGHTHAWEHVVLWFNDETDDPKLLAVATKSMWGYRTYAPPAAKYMDGDSFKVKYTWLGVSHHYLTATKEPGLLQDLVMWNNMSEPARHSIGSKKVPHFFKSPLRDNKFFDILEDSYPF